jgi:hypothetical protein
MEPIHIPSEWDDDDLLNFEQFCELIQTAPGTVRDWRRRRVGPRWERLEGCGRLVMKVAEARRFLRCAKPTRRERRDG